MSAKMSATRNSARKQWSFRRKVRLAILVCVILFVGSTLRHHLMLDVYAMGEVKLTSQRMYPWQSGRRSPFTYLILRFFPRKFFDTTTADISFQGRSLSRAVFQQMADNSIVTAIEFNDCTLPAGWAESLASGSEHLESLTLHDCSVSDEEVQAISRIPSLIYLTVTDSPITNAAATAIGSMQGLQSAKLQNTKIDDDGAAALLSAPKIGILDLSGSPVSGSCLVNLPESHRLVMHLDGATFRGISVPYDGPSSASRLFLRNAKIYLAEGEYFPLVYDLDLSGATLNERAFEALAQNDHIVHLRLDYVHIPAGGLKHVAAMRLTRLGLDHAACDATEFEALAASPFLQRLDVAATSIRDVDVRSILQSRKLIQLNLSETSVTDEIVPDLKSQTSLVFLNLEGTKISEAAAQDLLATLKDCVIYHPAIPLSESHKGR